MLPGFTGFSSSASEGQRAAESFSTQGVALASWHDWLTGGGTSPGGCEFIGTTTKCVVVTMWCKNNYRCWGPSGPYTTDTGWYICGVCTPKIDW